MVTGGVAVAEAATGLGQVIVGGRDVHGDGGEVEACCPVADRPIELAEGEGGAAEAGEDGAPRAAVLGEVDQPGLDPVQAADRLVAEAAQGGEGGRRSRRTRRRPGRRRRGRRGRPRAGPRPRRGAPGTGGGLAWPRQWTPRSASLVTRHRSGGRGPQTRSRAASDSSNRPSERRISELHDLGLAGRPATSPRPDRRRRGPRRAARACGGTRRGSRGSRRGSSRRPTPRPARRPVARAPRPRRAGRASHTRPRPVGGAGRASSGLPARSTASQARRADFLHPARHEQVVRQGPAREQGTHPRRVREGRPPGPPRRPGMRRRSRGGGGAAATRPSWKAQGRVPRLPPAPPRPAGAATPPRRTGPARPARRPADAGRRPRPEGRRGRSRRRVRPDLRRLLVMSFPMGEAEPAERVVTRGLTRRRRRPLRQPIDVVTQRRAERPPFALARGAPGAEEEMPCRDRGDRRDDAR